MAPVRQSQVAQVVEEEVAASTAVSTEICPELPIIWLELLKQLAMRQASFWILLER